MQDTQRLTPLEAITVLIGVADSNLSLVRQMAELQEMTPEERFRIENIEVAISSVQAMLNTALPIARFRCFVSVDVKSKARGMIRDEFTICAPTIHGILGGLIGLHNARTDVHVTLWEQKPLGAEMISGYQGPSKTSRYRSWVGSLLYIYNEAQNGTAPQDDTDRGAEEAGAQDSAGAEEGERRGDGDFHDSGFVYKRDKDA